MRTVGRGVRVAFVDGLATSRRRCGFELALAPARLGALEFGVQRARSESLVHGFARLLSVGVVWERCIKLGQRRPRQAGGVS